MAATPSIKVMKTFTYRGVTRTWSNRYHFNGGTPADSAHWTTFANAIVAAEAAALATTTTITETIGYAAGSDVPVFTKSYSTVGTVTPTGGQATPGDVATLVRYSTTARTPKNHPVYLYNYYHDAYNSASQKDQPLAALKTALGTYAGTWVTGISDGTNTYVRAGPNGATAVGSVVEAELTHRDFPR